MSETELPSDTPQPFDNVDLIIERWHDAKSWSNIILATYGIVNRSYEHRFMGQMMATIERLRSAEQSKDSAPKLSKAQRDAIHEWLDFSFQHPSDEALDAATESLASAIEGASATEQAQDEPKDVLLRHLCRVLLATLREPTATEFERESAMKRIEEIVNG